MAMKEKIYPYNNKNQVYISLGNWFTFYQLEYLRFLMQGRELAPITCATDRSLMNRKCINKVKGNVALTEAGLNNAIIYDQYRFFLMKDCCIAKTITECKYKEVK